jgi:hypothetical protein
LRQHLIVTTQHHFIVMLPAPLAQMEEHLISNEKVVSSILTGGSLKYFCDDMRHLVCEPYSIENLHIMAEDLNIKRCWFHKNHYDIPKKRIEEISGKAIKVSPRKILEIIKKFFEIFAF